MQNDKIKEYWEGEAGIYSEGIKAELKSETAENWKNLILEYAPEKEHLEVLDVGSFRFHTTQLCDRNS